MVRDRVERAPRRDEARHGHRRLRHWDPDARTYSGARTPGPARRSRRCLPRWYRGHVQRSSLVKDLRSVLGERVPHPRARRLHAVSAFARRAGPAAEGMTISITAAPPERLRWRRRRFVARVRTGDRQARRGLLGRRGAGDGGAARRDRQVGRQPRLGYAERLLDQGHERTPRAASRSTATATRLRRDHDLPDRARKADDLRGDHAATEPRSLGHCRSPPARCATALAWSGRKPNPLSSQRRESASRRGQRRPPVCRNFSE